MKCDSHWGILNKISAAEIRPKIYVSVDGARSAATTTQTGKESRPWQC